MLKFEGNQVCVLAFVAQFLFLSLEVVAENNVARRRGIVA